MLQVRCTERTSESNQYDCMCVPAVDNYRSEPADAEHRQQPRRAALRGSRRQPVRRRSAQAIQRVLQRRHGALDIAQLVEAEETDAEAAEICRLVALQGDAGRGEPRGQQRDALGSDPGTRSRARQRIDDRENIHQDMRARDVIVSAPHAPSEAFMTRLPVRCTLLFACVAIWVFGRRDFLV